MMGTASIENVALIALIAFVFLALPIAWIWRRFGWKPGAVILSFALIGTVLLVRGGGSDSHDILTGLTGAALKDGIEVLAEAGDDESAGLDNHRQWLLRLSGQDFAALLKAASDWSHEGCYAEPAPMARAGLPDTKRYCRSKGFKGRQLIAEMHFYPDDRIVFLDTFTH